MRKKCKQILRIVFLFCISLLIACGCASPKDNNEEEDSTIEDLIISLDLETGEVKEVAEGDCSKYYKYLV